MTESKKALLFIADYTDQGQDRIFLWSDGTLGEVTISDLVDQKHELVCHDLWLIAPSLYRATNKLPSNITDIEELRILTSGKKKERESRDKKDISQLLSSFVSEETIARYKEIFNRKIPLDEAVLSSIGEALLKCSEVVKIDANTAGEWERFITIERPVNDYLIRSTSEGISISEEKLRYHKNKIEFEFYMAIKEFFFRLRYASRGSIRSSRYRIPRAQRLRLYRPRRGLHFKFRPYAITFCRGLNSLKKDSKFT